MATKTGKPLIAIVDDDCAVSKAIARLVRSHGMSSRTFASGRQFLEALDTNESLDPDCVILDVHMRDLTGLQVQEQLAYRALDRLVIFVSAAQEPWVSEKALALGAAAFLHKPYDAGVLMATVRRVIDSHRNRMR